MTHALQLDASDEGALRAAGAGDFPHAIVSISSAIEASIFAVMALQNLGVGNIIAKAAQRPPRLDPRTCRGEPGRATRNGRWASGSPTRSPSAASSTTSTWGPGSASPRCAHRPAGSGRALRDLDLPIRLQLTPVALRRGDGVTINPAPDEVIRATDELILIGRDDRLGALADN